MGQIDFRKGGLTCRSQARAKSRMMTLPIDAGMRRPSYGMGRRPDETRSGTPHPLHGNLGGSAASTFTGPVVARRFECGTPDGVWTRECHRALRATIRSGAGSADVPDSARSPTDRRAAEPENADLTKPLVHTMASAGSGPSGGKQVREELKPPDGCVRLERTRWARGRQRTGDGTRSPDRGMKSAEA